MAETDAPRPLLQNPLSGTTIDTSVHDLGLQRSDGDEAPDRSLLKRGLDKLSKSTSLGRSKSGKDRRLSSSKPRPGREGTTGVKRAVEDREVSEDIVSKSNEEHASTVEESAAPPSTAITADLRDLGSPGLSPEDASQSRATPLDRLRPVRPSLLAFRGDGSMRAGTQTLIQALQAIPWAEDEAHEDLPTIEDEDHDDNDETDFTLTSSIHTIHRPVARLHRMQTSGQGLSTDVGISRIDHSEAEESDAEVEEGEDFEPLEDIGGSRYDALHASIDPQTSAPIGRRPTPARTASLATVKLQRRAKLAEKLRDIFGLQDLEEVLAEMPCWLLRSVLLQGYMFLTNTHLCFFAHLPSNEDQILKSGTLSKRASRTKRWNKYWFVLKNDVLSWYQSSSDPYFPHGNLDLQYAISCEPTGERGMRLRTNQKNVSLMADSVPSREEWVKTIRKVMFKAQNMGESVKIAIPFNLIVDVDRNNSMDFTETIEIKVFDKDDKDANYSVDSYFFAYFHDLPASLEQIQRIVRLHRHPEGSSAHVAAVRDTTSSVVISSIGTHDRAPSLPTSDSKSTASRLASLLRPFSSSSAHGPPRSNSSPAQVPASDDFTHIPRPVTASPEHDDSRTLRPHSFEPSESSQSLPVSQSTADSLPTTGGVTHREDLHTYPPSWPPSSSQQIDHGSQGRGWSVPHWLRTSSKLLSSSSTSSPHQSGGGGARQVMMSDYASDEEDERDTSNNLGFSLLDEVDAPQMPDSGIAEKFRSTFALDEKEVLLGYLPGSLFRVLPVFGRVYVSTNYFCFRSSQPLTKTRMIIPVRDIIALEKQRAFRFGYHGLVVVIKGHEELFFEFGSSDKRDACVSLLQTQIDVARQREVSADLSPSKGQRDALILEELEPTTSALEPEPIPPVEQLTDSLPAVMFTSTSSTFLTFKPHEQLRFTFLTIGSRGDVQPYIALGKGLIADGHRVKIATHGEYKAWVEGHGIEHAYVGGDPAELMRICVENGMFTVSFLKEGIQKFRGWIDDLLKTSWEACQDTDVLIESPSAMAGIHIAEGLRVPYFRAFTMPWTRTRAYPHAFAVPDRKMGGSYNYMTYVMFDQVFWRATSSQINRWRRNILGLPATNLDKLEQHKVPFLYNFSPTVVPPPLDWYEWIRVTGYWFLDDPDNSKVKKWSPPADLVRFIDTAHSANLKVVYIGFGSIVVSDPDAMTQCVIQAIQFSGVRAILSKGWSDRLSSKREGQPSEEDIIYPATIYPISSIPHDWLFPRIDAACHHGGAGTTGASLRAGIPTIIKPFFGDQFFWSDRVEALGIGSSVRKLTVESLTEALRSATTDERQISRARLVGQKIRSENGVANAVEAIYRDLEYARTLIKAVTGDAEDEPSARGDVTHPAEVHDGSVESSNGSVRGTSEDWEAVSYTSG